MADIEKVSETLEKITNSNLRYWVGNNLADMIEIHGLQQTAHDALELLKEKEAQNQCLMKKCVICPHCKNCDVDENGLLKETNN